MSPKSPTSPTSPLTEPEDRTYSKNTDNECKGENGTDCLYTMRRSGLYILSDPKGNLFYAPITDIKPKRSFSELKISRVWQYLDVVVQVETTRLNAIENEILAGSFMWP